MSFRSRLVLGAAYLVTAVVVALEIPLALNVSRRADSEFQSGVLGNAAVLAARASDLVAATDATAPRSQNVRRLAALTRGSVRGGFERIIVTDRRGRLLADSDRTAAVGTQYATEARPELGEALFRGRIDFRRRASASLGEELLLVTVPVVHNGRVAGAVRMSAGTGAVTTRVRGSWLRLAAIGLAVVAAALALACFLAASVARPLQRLGAAARGLGRGDLETRAPVEGPRELRDVAGSFNQMARALSANIGAQRDFLANASHQLRTPLTGLKLRLESLRAEGGEIAARAAKADAEVDRLSALVDDLLELARASSVDAAGGGREVDLGAAARRAVARWEEQAENAGKRLSLRDGGRATAWADESDLAHILDNLIENAIRYSPAGTEVAVASDVRDGRASLLVEDDGPGIPADDRARIFERFYRGTNGRRTGPGTGLGLAIVAELAARWGGEVRLLEGEGTRVEASFPAAAES